jgi:serine/threonine protein phosphatase PrpC
MSLFERKLEWRVIGRSVQGASHLRAGLPNQDAICWLPESGDELPVILVLSDGHGSAKSFRSDEGARLAVSEARSALLNFLLDPSAVEQAIEKLPQVLVERWERTVKEELVKRPISEVELTEVEKKGGVTARSEVELNPLLAYGATLLAALVTDSFIIYLQIGDGDILTVFETGEVLRPLPGDERLFGNETTSLCSKNAWKDFRIEIQPLSGGSPALILLSTDGYANSFRDEAGFLKVGTDFLDIIRSNGLDEVNRSLETWLTEASQYGSGDDVTVGIICRKGL